MSINTHVLKVISRSDKKIPLSKGRDDNRVFYITGLALQLSKYEKLPAMEIADAIVSHLSAKSADIFSVKIVPPGWIHLELAHPVLAVWLQSLVGGGVGNWALGKGHWARGIGQGASGIGQGALGNGQGALGNGQGALGNGQGALGNGQGASSGMGRKTNNSQFPIPNSQFPIPNAQCPMPNAQFPTPVFTIQYAHARCCSLLRMAKREGLIPPEATIPWLNSEQKLRLNHSAELRLISKLVQVVDEFECCGSGGSVHWEKNALSLSQTFENFWRSCRIWDEVKTTSPELAQARLGLIMATQSVLKFLLEEKLNVFAPLEF